MVPNQLLSTPSPDIKVERQASAAHGVPGAERGGASWGCRLTAPSCEVRERDGPRAADQVGTWMGPVPRVSVMGQ